MVLALIDGIPLDGFSEPISVRLLHETRCSAIPGNSGIYLVTRTSDSIPCFLDESTGGSFKGRNPTASLDVMQAAWVQGAQIVYVGKAAGQKGLKQRLRQLIDFGYGKPVGHWGGRLLWHLSDRENLLVRWRTCPKAEADQAETTAIAKFKNVYDGRRPYANLAK